MHVIERTASRLVLQEKPWLIGFVGGLFVVAGGFVAVTSDERLFGLAFVALGALLILAFANTVTAVFDRATSRFTRSVRGLVRNNEITHSLEDIVSVRVDASHSGNPSRSYRITLGRSSGDPVPLTTDYSSGKGDKDRLAGVIREFLSEAPEVPLPGFRDLFRLMNDPDAAARLSEMYSGPEARVHLEAARQAAIHRGQPEVVQQIDGLLRRVTETRDGK
jgi:hypothetical protein